MQPDEVRAFVKREGITLRENDWSGSAGRKTDKRRYKTYYASEAEKRRAISIRRMMWGKKQTSGVCACGRPATVRTGGAGVSFVCDRCLLWEREYYDTRRRGRTIMTSEERKEQDGN
jgi:hypothetical protein